MELQTPEADRRSSSYRWAFAIGYFAFSGSWVETATTYRPKMARSARHQTRDGYGRIGDGANSKSPRARAWEHHQLPIGRYRRTSRVCRAAARVLGRRQCVMAGLAAHLGICTIASARCDASRARGASTNLDLGAAVALRAPVRTMIPNHASERPGTRRRPKRDRACEK